MIDTDNVIHIHAVRRSPNLPVAAKLGGVSEIGNAGPVGKAKLGQYRARTRSAERVAILIPQTI